MDLIGAIENWFGGAQEELQQALVPIMPWAQGIYQLVKKDAEAALKEAGGKIETMALADFHSLVATVQNAVLGANGHSGLSGADKFALVAESIKTQLAANLWPTIKSLGTASLNALINAAYAAVASGVIGAL
ncbi:MAG TPA: hypothetical protein VKV28_04780 [Candidatus Binataceae bacterium]|nr:hypothetical protein [Candidatus Binataceae bacterium]